MMYSAYELNKQDDNIELWWTPFPIWNQSIVSCLIQTVASLPEYRFLRKQVRWSGIPISLRILHFFCVCVIHTVKGFGVVNKAEVDVFLELSFMWYQIPLCLYHSVTPFEVPNTLYVLQKSMCSLFYWV